MRSQPNFSSLAGQAEELLKRLQIEGDPTYEANVPLCQVVLQKNSLILFLICVLSAEVEKNVRPAQQDMEQDEEVTDDEDSGLEVSHDPGGILDFPALAIAEQLTRKDSVRGRIYCSKCLLFNMDDLRQLTGFHAVLGSVCQSDAIPVSGLCVVKKRQEGKHVANHTSHRYTIQRRHQAGHHVPSLPAGRRNLQPHLLPPASHYTRSQGSHHREVDLCSPGQSESFIEGE